MYKVSVEIWDLSCHSLLVTLSLGQWQRLSQAEKLRSKISASNPEYRVLLKIEEVNDKE